MKIRSLGAELFHSDKQGCGETDMSKPMVAFCNFANAPKNCYIIFSASCNYTYLKNVTKVRLQCLIKIISFYYFVLIKDLIHLVNFISNNVLPHDANFLHICITHSQVKSHGPAGRGWKRMYHSGRHGMEPVGESTLPPTPVAGDLGRDSSIADEHRTRVPGPDSRLEPFGVSSAAWYKTITPDN